MAASPAADNTDQPITVLPMARHHPVTTSSTSSCVGIARPAVIPASTPPVSPSECIVVILPLVRDQRRARCDQVTVTMMLSQPLAPLG